MGDVITYWNRGAREWCSWTAEEAIGQRSREIPQAIFPVPVEDISAEVLQAGRWEGELKRQEMVCTPVMWRRKMLIIAQHPTHNPVYVKLTYLSSILLND
jgi:PAS domain-containing protein